MRPMEEPTQFLSPEDVAERLSLNVRTIRRYIREGRLKATRIGKQYRIAASDFQAFVARDQPAGTAAPRSRRVIVSATADIHAIGPHESDRVIAALSGAFTANADRPGTHLECIYYREEELLRVVLNAELEFTRAVLRLISSVLADGPAPRLSKGSEE